MLMNSRGSSSSDGKRRGIAPAARPAQPVPLAPSICTRMYTQARAGLVQALGFHARRGFMRWLALVVRIVCSFAFARTRIRCALPQPLSHTAALGGTSIHA